MINRALWVMTFFFSSVAFSDIPNTPSYRVMTSTEFQAYFEFTSFITDGFYSYSLVPKLNNAYCENGLVSGEISIMAGKKKRLLISNSLKKLNISQFTSYSLSFRTAEKLTGISFTYTLEGCPQLNKSDALLFNKFE
ncbi:hypothetical protein CW748_00215 [Alteromonadales bacterium alter-6D02]|nr:hypothetical protein CW748_00215 [Alteromonadales bacterium alter-6D02]